MGKYKKPTTTELPDEPESARAMLESALILTILHWRDEYPDASDCLVLSVLESLTAEWRKP